MRPAHLTCAQVAKRLAVSPKTISRWAREGRLAHTRTLGGHRRYDPAYIDQLAKQLAQPIGQPDQ
ncbi:MAG TPA: helix-turn-helix domain-containing protein [Actinomycetes bacterium]|jgi:excisionase family DNA binding protein|nr:helix-turn-helix domain-containing protein [Actinomycetes bacterium]